MKSISRWSPVNIVFAVLFFLYFCNNVAATERPKVGLALSGGGAMGLAHIGILHTLDSLDIPVDYIAGTSMGGIVGALYAVGYSSGEIDSLARTIGWAQLFRDIPSQQAMPYYLKQDKKRYQLNIEMQNFQPVTSGLIRGQNIRLLFTDLTEQFLTVQDFHRLPIPFTCTAVDLHSGKVVELDHGSLPTAMRATMSIPSVFTPVELDSLLLIDGGILNNLPTDIVRHMGADIVIASAVRNPATDTENIRSIIDVVSQSFHIARNSQIDDRAKLADLVVDIRLPGKSSADFSQKSLRQIMSQGYRAARARTDTLKRLKSRYQLNRTPVHLPKPDTVNYRIDSIATYGHLTPLSADARATFINLKGNQYAPSVLDSITTELLATDRFSSVRYTTTITGPHTIRVQFFIQKDTSPIIDHVTIHGNQLVSSSFIQDALFLHPGDRYKSSQLKQRINYLYSLGYFTNIAYDLSVSGEESVDLDVTVAEHSFQTLRLSVQYDNYYHLVPLMKFDWDNLLFSGLRWETQMQVMGYTRLGTELSYHPQEVLYSVYPFVRAEYQEIPKSVYNGLSQRLTIFQDRRTSLTFGTGLQFRENIFSHLGFTLEELWLAPALQLQIPDLTLTPKTNHTLHSLYASGKFDFLDNYLTPSRGFILEAAYEMSDSEYLGSDINYRRFESSLDYYRPLGKRHNAHLNLYFAHGFHNLPIQKYFYSGGPTSFIGLQYDQLLVQSLTSLRADYSYKIRKDLYLKVIGNYALNFQHLAHQAQSQGTLYGYGIALQYNVFLGPAILTIANGPESVLRDTGRQTVGYFTLGYRF